jgi:hypothetical protein
MARKCTGRRVSKGEWNVLPLQLHILWLSLFHHASHSVEGIMLDNVVISTQPIGCLGNITLPAAPTGLAVF